MALPICYLITSFPIFVFMIQGFFIQSSQKEKIFYLNAAYCIGTILMYVNNSINILFYIVFGKTLRNDFIKILPITHCIKEKLLRDDHLTHSKRKTCENNFS